jgi:hypothetical protein
MKRLLFALFTLFAIGHAATAQNVTFDVSGTYPANFATSKLTAPDAAFLIEFTVKQIVPATPPNSPLFFQTPLIAASYTFKGVTHPAPATSSFFHSDSAGNLDAISLTFTTGTFVLSSNPFFHSPLFATRSGANAVFLLGDLGAGQSWHVEYNPNGAPRVSNPVSVTDVVSRTASLH